MWSTSNCHHVNPPVSAMVKSKIVYLDYYGLKVNIYIAFECNEHCLHAIYSNFPVAEVSCVCSDKARCPLPTVNVDSKHPTLCIKLPTCLWNGNYLIFPGISIFGIEYPLPNARDLRNLWSYVICKGIQMTIPADHLDNVGFNVTAKSSLLESMHIINRKITSPNGCHGCNVVTFFTLNMWGPS